MDFSGLLFGYKLNYLGSYTEPRKEAPGMDPAFSTP